MDLSKLKSYRCHKVVRAARITSIIRGDCGAELVMGDINPKYVENMPAWWVAKHTPASGGYLVVYEDGYLSYSPAKAFEDGYKVIDLDADAKAVMSSGRGIGWAVKQMQDGDKVRRAGWNGKGVFLMYAVCVRLDTPYEVALRDVPNVPDGVEINPHVDMWTAQGTMQPGWLCSMTDMLATDWELA